MQKIQELKNKKLFLLDMDGTIYLDDVLFDKSLEFLNHINSIGGKYVFLTNNSSKSVDDYIEKLRALSIVVDESNFMTSSQATALHLIDVYKDKKIYVVGTESFKEELRGYDLCITDRLEDDIESLVVGFDTELSYKKIQDACELLYKGIDFIATNSDLACPTAFGFVPDCGAICNMLETATSRKPLYLGKPNPLLVELAIANTGFTRDETMVIGDRLYTDIACGINAGVTTGVVLTGETKIEDLEQTMYKPDYIFSGIHQLFEVLIPLK